MQVILNNLTFALFDPKMITDKVKDDLLSGYVILTT